jgi:integron integrase
MEEHRPKKLLDQVRDAIRLKHYSYRTEQAYVGWIKRYIYFHNVHHPSEMGAPEVEAFLTHLAVKENVAASTQNQALGALLFLYREVLHQDLGPVDALRAKRPKRLPTVLTKDETLRLIGCLSGTHQLMAKLIYGSGIRLMECLRLRVKDLEFERRAIIVRDGKGAQDRVTVLPDSLIPLFQEHLQRVKALHEQDLAQGYGAVYLPDALAQVSERRSGMGLAIRLSSQLAIPGSTFWRHSPPPPARKQPAKSDQGGSPSGRHQQAGWSPHASSLLCGSSFGTRL